MGLFDHFGDSSDDHENYNAQKHKAEVSHELLGGAAAYAAAHEYEKYLAKNGKPDNHAQAKEIIAGLAGAFIERELETKGADFVDKQKAKHYAKKKAEEAVDRGGEDFYGN